MKRGNGFKGLRNSLYGRFPSTNERKKHNKKSRPNYDAYIELNTKIPFRFFYSLIYSILCALERTRTSTPEATDPKSAAYTIPPLRLIFSITKIKFF